MAQGADILVCGLIIASPSGWLLAHRTRSPWWDLPKGRQDPGERPIETALRECREETGLDLESHRLLIQDLGVATYSLRRNKQLHLFRLDLTAPVTLSDCKSVARQGPLGERLPEMDGFAWVAEEKVVHYVRPRMARHLRARGLVRDITLLPQ